jgi:hypothetical protein
MFYFNADILQRMQLSDIEKKELGLEVIKLMKLQQDVQRDGILSLFECLEEIDDPFFKVALTMLYDGFDKNYIETILATLILVEAPTGYALVLMLIEAEAVLSMADGDPLEKMLMKIGAFLGPQSLIKLAPLVKELEL